MYKRRRCEPKLIPSGKEKSFRCQLAEKLSYDEGQDLHSSGGRRKCNTTMMSLVNNGCKALRDTIVICTKMVHLLYK
jgi:hypothetical protein